eukprot:5755173-Amphidinium_carterae.1
MQTIDVLFQQDVGGIRALGSEPPAMRMLSRSMLHSRDSQAWLASGSVGRGADAAARDIGMGLSSCVPSASST